MTDIDATLWWVFAVFHTVSLVVAFQVGEVDAWRQCILADAYIAAIAVSVDRWWWQRRRRTLKRNRYLVDDDDGE